MKKWYSKIVIGFVFLFLYLPILVLIIYSFNDSKMNILFEGFTWKWYSVLMSNRTLLSAFQNTLVVAVSSTLVSVLVGTISAFGLSRFDFPLKKVINQLLYIPIVIPEIVLGISLLSVYTLMRLNLSLFTLILAHITFSIPYVIVSVRSTIEGMNPYLEEASSDLGASSFQTFFRVTLPSIAPGIWSGAMLAFTLSMDDVVISYFTAGPEANTLPLYIYSMIKSGIRPDVNALFSILLLITFICLTIYAFLLFKKRVRV